MQSFKEQQGEIRKPSSVINAKKQRKTREWERQEIFLFKKIRDIKGIFHAKMGTVKDRSGKDLTEEKYITARKKKCYQLSLSGKDQRSLQENQRYQGNISCKDGHSKRQK